MKALLKHVPQLSMLAANYWIANEVWAWAERRQLSKFHINCTVAFALHLAAFWSFSLATAVVDSFQWPGWLHNLRIQKRPKPTPVAKQAEISFYVLLLQVFVSLPALYVAAPYFGGAMGERPGVLKALAHFAFCVAVEEVGFFYTHWALHSKLLYKRFHRRHHLLTRPTGPAAEYAHPLEFLFGNVAPTMLGPILCGAHPATCYWWTLVAIQVTCSGHSDLYHPYWPWGDARRHDFHHSHIIGSYGPMGFLDRLHGTESAWEAFSAKREADEAKAAAAAAKSD